MTDFYKTFLINIFNKQEEKESEKKESEKKESDDSSDINKYLRISDFRKQIFNELGFNYETIKFCSSGLLYYIRKPHRCLYTTDKYFICVDMYTNVFCIYYKTLLMIDVDYKDGKCSCLEDVEKMIDEKNKDKKDKKDNKDTYVIYSSDRGAHIFVINREFDYRSKEAIDYMINFGSDANYIIHTYLVGWVSRLNRKFENDTLYKFRKIIGDDILPELLKLVRLQDKFSLLFRNEIKYDKDFKSLEKL